MHTSLFINMEISVFPIHMSIAAKKMQIIIYSKEFLILSVP